MLNRIKLLIAGAVAAAAALPLASAADNVTVTRESSTVTYAPGAILAGDAKVQLPAGITAQNLNDDKSIDKALKSLTESALTHNGFDNIVSMLSDQDKDRLKANLGKSSYNNVDGNNNKRLNDLADSLNNTWKSKFNGKFDIEYSKTFTQEFLSIATGKVSDPGALIGKWPVDVGLSPDRAGKVTPQDAQEAQNKAFGGRVNLEAGREIAVAHIMAGHGMPGINASLIHETASGWKLDVPNTLTAQKLYDNLVANLSFVDQHRDALPSDVNEANRQIAHAVLAAMYDIDLSQGAAAKNLPAGSVRPADGGTVINR